MINLIVEVQQILCDNLIYILQSTIVVTNSNVLICTWSLSWTPKQAKHNIGSQQIHSVKDPYLCNPKFWHSELLARCQHDRLLHLMLAKCHKSWIGFHFLRTLVVGPCVYRSAKRRWLHDILYRELSCTVCQNSHYHVQ